MTFCFCFRVELHRNNLSNLQKQPMGAKYISVSILWPRVGLDWCFVSCHILSFLYANVLLLTTINNLTIKKTAYEKLENVTKFFESLAEWFPRQLFKFQVNVLENGANATLFKYRKKCRFIITTPCR